MKGFRRLSSFLMVFAMLSWSVAAISAAVFGDDADANESALTAVGAPAAQKAFKPRLTAPAPTNPYYYSDRNVFYEYGWGMPNCTCYAWGRAYELLGEEPDLCVYSAHLWYDYNLENGCYPCGQEPKLGAIACWKYSSGTSGHVAVVEKITDDQITFSNSAYSGIEFYTNTAPINDPSDGRKTWIFQGYIYIGNFAASEEPDEPSGPLYRITSEDGVNVRSAPGLGGSVLGWLFYEQEVAVTETRQADGYTWGLFDYDGTAGWFALDFAEMIGGDQISAPPSTAENRQTGDVDGDGSITILDATHIQRILVKLLVPDDETRSASDYDGDGSITILDANRIQCYLVNLD